MRLRGSSSAGGHAATARCSAERMFTIQRRVPECRRDGELLRATRVKSSTGSTSTASAISMNSGTFTWRCWLSIMPITECGRFRRAASCLCVSPACLRASAMTAATARAAVLLKAFKGALRFYERTTNTAEPPRFDFPSKAAAIVTSPQDRHPAVDGRCANQMSMPFSQQLPAEQKEASPHALWARAYRIQIRWQRLWP